MQSSPSSIRSGSQEPPRLGPTPELRRDRLGMLMFAARSLGDVVQMRFRTRDFYLFVHPDAVQHILVTNQRNYRKGPDQPYLKPVIGEGLITSDGEAHLLHRRMIQPAFHRTRIVAYADAMTAYATDMLDAWQPGGTIDIYQEMLFLTLRIVVKTLCSVDVEDGVDPIGQEMKAALAHFVGQHDTLLPSARRASNDLDEIIYQLIDRRRVANEDTGDLLSVLLASDADPSLPEEARLTDRQIRDEIMTLFFAGHDTSAATLSWAWYLLATNPEIEARLHEEVDTVLQGRLPTVEDLPRLRYTTMIFAETMRLYPAVWSISRDTVADDEVMGYHVPAGMAVMVSPAVTQHDPRFFPDPERFDPERFHPDRDVRRTLPRMAYFPFGGGTRQCMGEPLAWMEGTLLMATIAQRYRFHLDPDHAVAPQSHITLRPKDGVRATLEAR